MTPVFCCGFECGNPATGTSNIGQHVILVGTSAFATSPVRSGARSLRTNPTAGSGYGQASLSISSDKSTSRSYIYVATDPIANGVVLGPNRNSGATFYRIGLAYKTTDSKWYAAFDDGTTVTYGATGVTISLNTWTLIDIKWAGTANPWTCDIQVDGVALGQATLAVAAHTGGTSSPCVFGAGDVRAVNTFDIYHDDFLASETVADYPLGAGFVNHFVPTADGTHNIAGAADFRRGDTTTDILNATTTAYQLVDDVPMDDRTPDADDHIRIVAPPNATDYVEVIFGPAPGISTPAVAPRIVEVGIEYFAAGTGNSDEIMKLNDDGTLVNLYDGTGIAGEALGRYKWNRYRLAPTGGAWTVVAGAGNFNNIRLRYGYASDANPDKSLMCAMIEAEFAPVVAGARQRLHIIEED